MGLFRPVDELLKDLLMTAFDRGPKTLQRWFRAGVVPNARQTKGGSGRGGNYRIKTPAQTKRKHVLRWKKMVIAQHKQSLGRVLKGGPGMVLYDADERDFPEAFRLWCIRAQVEVGAYMKRHPLGRQWPKPTAGVRRRRKIPQS